MDPRIAAELVAMVDQRVAQHLRAQRRTAYGEVNTVDSVNFKASVYVSGDGFASAGFSFPPWMPIVVGDRVRVVIDPRGDRYIDAVLGADSAAPSVLRQERDTSDFAVTTGTITVVAYNGFVINKDPVNDFNGNDPTNGQITVNRDGIYDIACGVGWAPSDVGRREVYLRVNGITVAGDSKSTPTGFSAINFYMNADAKVALVAGDVVSVEVRHSHGSNLGVIASPGSFIQISRVRP